MDIKKYYFIEFLFGKFVNMRIKQLD